MHTGQTLELVMKTMTIDGRIGQILEHVMKTMTIDRNNMGV